jgi:hypothetical protein
LEPLAQRPKIIATRRPSSTIGALRHVSCRRQRIGVATLGYLSLPALPLVAITRRERWPPRARSRPAGGALIFEHHRSAVASLWRRNDPSLRRRPPLSMGVNFLTLLALGEEARLRAPQPPHLMLRLLLHPPLQPQATWLKNGPMLSFANACRSLIGPSIASNGRLLVS